MIETFSWTNINMEIQMCNFHKNMNASLGNVDSEDEIEKSGKNLLTNSNESDRIVKLSRRRRDITGLGEDKFFKKSFKKDLTRGRRSDIIDRLTRKRRVTYTECK